MAERRTGKIERRIGRVDRRIRLRALERRSHILWIGFGLAVIFWVLSAMNDAYLFHKCTFLECLFPKDPNELWLRTIVCSLVIGFAGYAQWMATLIARLNEERETFHEEMVDALSTALSGYIKICAWCKTVHEEGGSWKPVEEYVQTHTRAQFTHSICPQCAERENKRVSWQKMR